jgi:glycerophosphoryl diester phosphodiesterase
MRSKGRLLITILVLVFGAMALMLTLRERGTTWSERLILGAPPDPKTYSPVIIAHRGASGYRPEHTIEAYDLGIKMGAHFIEPDLVITKDGFLIARHENELSETTDVAEKFPDRRTTKVIDGKTVSGWFSEDFTLSEIKNLRAKTRGNFRNKDFDGYFQIATLEEIIDLIRKRSAELDRPIGLYAELKTPSYFSSLGLPLEPALLMQLERVRWLSAGDPVVIQCFELSSLKDLAQKTGLRLVLLLGADRSAHARLLEPEGLKELAKTLYGIAPHKRLIVPATATGQIQNPTTLVQDAHAAGLKVHVYTFRNELESLARFYEGDPFKEYIQFFELGVDGLFTDHPDTALKALQWYREQN